MSVLALLLTLVFLSISFPCIFAVDPPPPSCSSEIYCHGELLHAVQMARIYNDSKSFVDMKLKKSPNETLENFAKLKNRTKESLKQFVNSYFEEPGSEFENWTPPDWKESPKILAKTIPKYKNLTKSLNLLWKQLGRKIKEDVKKNPDLYSMIYVPNPVIIPGGRFREFYYWDSYWIIQGLMQSEMYDTAKGMIENYLYMIDNLGHIPNGGRIYYNERSQPPLLIPIIKAYYDAKKDVEFLKKNIASMQKEFDYWTREHTRIVRVNNVNYTLSTYGARIIAGPRPESYREDYLSASNFTEDQKDTFYSELKAAAESGWDFSSRWFIKGGENKGNLSDTKIRSIVPVDLNAFLYWNAKILSEFNSLIGNNSQSEKYNNLANARLEAITKVLWDENNGVWLDYDLINNKRREYFAPSNLAPLWTGAFDANNKKTISKAVLKYLEKTTAVHPGGIPTTLEQTGEQWDYPNAWPPLQYMVIMGLDNLGTEESEKAAWDIAQKWIESNFLAFNREASMYEKYDATSPGKYGSGGEYAVQLGFGWTNGIILELFDKYSDKLKEPEKTDENFGVSLQSNFWLILIVGWISSRILM